MTKQNKISIVIEENIAINGENKGAVLLKSFFMKYGNWTLIPQKEINKLVKDIQKLVNKIKEV